VFESAFEDGQVVMAEELGPFDYFKKLKKGKRKFVVPPVLEGPVPDTHCHFDSLYDPALEIARCAVHGVDFLCTVVDVVEDADTTLAQLDTWCARAREILVEQGVVSTPEQASFPHIRVVMGCHPHNASDFTPEVMAVLRERLRDPRVCAIGEIGLDYHYDLSARDVQRDVFRQQIKLAHELGFPIQLHLREAHDDAYEILCEEGFPTGGVQLHCFNLDYTEMQRWIEKGCWFSLGGALTFVDADDLREAARLCPEELLLTETDCPYMTPVPMRGTKCGPHHVIFTADCLAGVRGFTMPDERAAFFARLGANARGLLDREALPWQRG